MVLYNPKEWVTAIFRFHKTDTFRTLLASIIFIMVYSWGIVYLEREYLKLGETSYARNLTILHSLLGFAISMLLVFRTNTAYERWWEGRKLWGSLVNNSRNIAIKLNVFIPQGDQHSRLFFKQIIPLYAFALKRHLLKETTQFALDENPHPELPELNTATHLPNRIAESILKEIMMLHQKKQINDFQLLMLNNEWQSLTDICGACERIKNTPIPYSYSSFIKKFIFLYVITMPLGFALTLGYFTIPVTAFMFYILASLELIAEEIEDPFGNDSNDLPMGKIAENIGANVCDILVCQ
jgi:ion channel-forming bestrophin family protein